MPVITPWGAPDDHIQIQEGLDWYGTPSHGGYRVATALYKEACARQGIPEKEPDPEDGPVHMWFEEDCDWAFVAIAFPEHFQEEQDDVPVLMLAEKAILHTYPEYWEKWKGRELQPGESMEKDRLEFMKAHKGEYMESRSGTLVTGTIIIYATPDGDRRSDDERIFLVPDEKYLKADLECNGCHPYLPDRDDIEVTRAELEALRRLIQHETLRLQDSFAPVGIMEGTSPDTVNLVCRRSASGFYLDGVDRIPVEIPKSQWESRDVRSFHIVEKDEDGNWKLFNAGDVEEESTAPSP